MLQLPSFFLIFVPIISFAQDWEDLAAVTIPSILENASIRTVIETTECSVTCGIGSKIEKRCLVNRAGIQDDCEVVRVDCLRNWLCGMQIYTVKTGHNFIMDCQIPPTGTLGGQKLYYWRRASATISTNERYFQPLKVTNHTLVLDSIQEEDAGTYLCDVQREDDLKLVKRIFFGVKVIATGIMDIDFDKYLISKQQLTTLTEGITAPVVEEKVELHGGIYSYVAIGSSVGLLAGVLVLVFSRCTFRSRKRGEKGEDSQNAAEL